MYGNERRRFCGDCKLNVYNLSDMTRQEAENLLLTSEGRLCVRFFRRADGTVLTKNCPVGWRAVTQRVSRSATAAFSMLASLFGGIFAFNLFRDPPHEGVFRKVVSDPVPIMGEVVNYPVFQGGIGASDDEQFSNGGNFELGVRVVEAEVPARRPSRRK